MSESSSLINESLDENDFKALPKPSHRNTLIASPG